MLAVRSVLRPASAAAAPSTVHGRSAQVEHEASTSKINDDQLFYCRQRGLTEEDASTMIVNGFCREVFDQLPMEYAVEAQALMRVSLEGAVG